MNTFGDRIKTLRKRKKLSQSELGEAVGLDQSSICKLEQETVDRNAGIVKIAHVLGVNPLWLITGKGSPDVEYVHPVAVPKKYGKEIEEVIKLMESSDDRGRLKILIAAQDVFDEHQARKKLVQRATSHEDEELEIVKSFVQDKLPDLLEEELPSSGGAYSLQEKDRGQTGTNH